LGLQQSLLLQRFHPRLRQHKRLRKQTQFRYLSVKKASIRILLESVLLHLRKQKAGLLVPAPSVAMGLIPLAKAEGAHVRVMEEFRFGAKKNT
jgi:hypothetical protein